MPGKDDKGTDAPTALVMTASGQQQYFDDLEKQFASGLARKLGGGATGLGFGS